MAHTAGPWHVDETKALGSYGVWTDYATHPGHDGAGYSSQICSMGPAVKSEITREQRDANARLIAAAPDLLAACEGLLHCLAENYEIQDMDCDCGAKTVEAGACDYCRGMVAMRAARAAIDKAKGGA